MLWGIRIAFLLARRYANVGLCDSNVYVRMNEDRPLLSATTL